MQQGKTYHVLLLCALKDEYDQVLKVEKGITGPGWVEQKKSDGWIVANAFFDTGMGSGIHIIATWAPYMGREQTQTVAHRMLTDEAVDCIAMSGICAGRKGKVSLGDVIFAERLWSYDAGKTVAKDGTALFQGDMLQFRPKPIWVQRAQQLATLKNEEWLSLRPDKPLEYQEDWTLLRLLEGQIPSDHVDFADACPNWQEVLPRLRKRNWVEKPLKLTSKGKERAEELRLTHIGGLPEPKSFRVHIAPLATGASVTEDSGLFARLSSSMRKVLGIDMEASALVALGEAHDIPVLIAKGVSDYGDAFKDDRYRDFAARASAEWLIGLLRNSADLLEKNQSKKQSINQDSPAGWSIPNKNTEVSNGAASSESENVSSDGYVSKQDLEKFKADLLKQLGIEVETPGGQQNSLGAKFLGIGSQAVPEELPELGGDAEPSLESAQPGNQKPTTGELTSTSVALSTSGPAVTGDRAAEVHSCRPSFKLDPSEFLKLPEKISKALSSWNNLEAYELAEKLESGLDGIDTASCPVTVQILYLIARTRAIYLETHEDQRTEEEVAKFANVLDWIESLPAYGQDADLRDRIEALRGSLVNIKNGAEAALERLWKSETPYAIRIRLAVLLKKEDIDKALSLIDGREPHLWWCDPAVRIFTLKERSDEAKKLLDWVKNQNDEGKYRQCLISYADALLVRVNQSLPKKYALFPGDILPETKTIIEEIFSTLEPITSSALDKKGIPSGVETTALRIAWLALRILGETGEMEPITQKLLGVSPVPIEVAKAALAGICEPPDDLPLRLRTDHPKDMDAGMLACLLETVKMGKHKEALAGAKALVPLADTPEKKEELSKLFQQLWQMLDGEAREECEKANFDLLADSPCLSAIFEAAIAARNGNPDRALELLDANKDEKNPGWLQLRAGVLVNKERLPEALEMFSKAARLMQEPGLIMKAATLALDLKKYDQAIEFFELLLKYQPENTQVRGALTEIYSLKKKEFWKAIPHYRRILEQTPDDFSILNNLALCLAQVFRWEEALEVLDRACDLPETPIQIVLMRSEIFASLGKTEKAFDSLEAFRKQFWGDQRFLMAYMNAGFAANEDDLGIQALPELNRLRKEGTVDDELFRGGVGIEEMKNLLAEQHKQQKEQHENLHDAMLQGRMPWTWAAKISGVPFYNAWRHRTQELRWLGDNPVDRAGFSVYSTNGFQVGRDEDGRKRLLPLTASEKGKPIVADVSALITLHRLGMLDAAADYYGEIIMPEAYLGSVLLEARKLVAVQQSRIKSAEAIEDFVRYERIRVLAGQEDDFVLVDEYGDGDECRYRFCDLLAPLYDAGKVPERLIEKAQVICTKESAVDEDHPVLALGQAVKIESVSLDSLTATGLLDAVARNYQIYIDKETLQEVKSRRGQADYQKETREWHFDLWDKLRDDDRFVFVSHTVPPEMQGEDDESPDIFSFFSYFVAAERDLPLLADDRVLQVMAYTVRTNKEHATFGTDALLYRLAEDDAVTEEKAAEAILQLMRWRYRFILPPANLLLSLACEYKSHLPGTALQTVAEYVQDCMRDPGLFGGSEDTDLHESMAARLWLSWSSTVAQFLTSVWRDPGFDLEAAKTLTHWVLTELLPAPPANVPIPVKIRSGETTATMVVSDLMINLASCEDKARVTKCLTAAKEALGLTDTEYKRVVTGILNAI